MSRVQNERETTYKAISWLRSQGWICRRNHVGLFTTQYGSPIKIGEVGSCDWYCIRASDGKCIQYMEVEFKGSGKKPRKEQREYIAKRTHQGFNATWADSLEMLKAWYEERYR